MKRSFLGLALRLAAAALLAIMICGAAAAPSATPTAAAPSAFAVTAITQPSTTSTTASTTMRAQHGVTGVNGNPWGYNYSCCHLIRHPAGRICTYFSCIKSFWHQTRGYVEQCRDGTISHSGGRRGSCSSHGGNRRPLFQP